MFSTKSFIENTKQNTGATLWFCNEQYKGYVVAAKGHELTVSQDEFNRGFTPSIYLQCAFDLGYNLAGAWVNGGVVYLDCCLHFNNYESAKQFALDNEQVAFYCIDGDYVIEC